MTGYQSICVLFEGYLKKSPVDNETDKNFVIDWASDASFLNNQMISLRHQI